MVKQDPNCTAGDAVNFGIAGLVIKKIGLMYTPVIKKDLFRSPVGRNRCALKVFWSFQAPGWPYTLLRCYRTSFSSVQFVGKCGWVGWAWGSYDQTSVCETLHMMDLHLGDVFEAMQVQDKRGLRMLWECALTSTVRVRVGSSKKYAIVDTMRISEALEMRHRGARTLSFCFANSSNV